MSTRRRPAEESPEVDPTGMRQLLSSLPDPGPMPPDLVSRITAALEHERAVSSGFERRRRRPAPAPRPNPGWRGALLVAAAAAVVLVTVPLATGTAPSGVSALFGQGDVAQSSGAARASQQAEAGQPTAADTGGPGVGLPSLPSEGRVGVRQTGTAYTTARLTEQARALLAAQGTQLDLGASDSKQVGPMGTPTGARSCATGMGVPPSQPLSVDLATFDGAPAAIMVVGEGAGATVYAVARWCTGSTDALLAGPEVVQP